MEPYERSNYVKFLAISVPRDNVIDDTIEVISTHYEIVDVLSPPRRKPRKSILDDLKIFQDEVTRKRLARGVMLIGGIFILLSGILLIVSLSMSKNIDDIGKNFTVMSAIIAC